MITSVTRCHNYCRTLFTEMYERDDTVGSMSYLRCVPDTIQWPCRNESALDERMICGWRKRTAWELAVLSSAPFLRNTAYKDKAVPVDSK